MWRTLKGVSFIMAIFRATDIVEMAMELEKSGEIFYGAVAQKAMSPEVRALFVELAEQEKYHYAAFKKMSGTVWDQPSAASEEWDQYLMYLQATIKSAFFEGSDKALTLAEQVTDEKEALQMALDFEKETMLFFHDLRDKVADADQPVVAGIIEEERSHVQRLGLMLQGV
jgi:rubrerythrin